MKKFTQQQADEILAQGRATIANVDAALDDRRTAIDDDEGKCDPWVDFEPRIESRNERDRRELAERDERWARERRREQRQENDIEARVMSHVDHRIAALRSELRNDMIELAKAARQAIETLDSAVVDMRATGPSMVTTVNEMFEKLAAKIDALPGSVSELPNPIGGNARRVN